MRVVRTLEIVTNLRCMFFQRNCSQVQEEPRIDEVREKVSGVSRSMTDGWKYEINPRFRKKKIDI